MPLALEMPASSPLFEVTSPSSVSCAWCHRHTSIKFHMEAPAQSHLPPWTLSVYNVLMAMHGAVFHIGPPPHSHGFGQDPKYCSSEQF